MDNKSDIYSYELFITLSKFTKVALEHLKALALMLRIVRAVSNHLNHDQLSNQKG